MKLPGNMVFFAEESAPAPPEEQLRMEMERRGLNPPTITIDGNLHRFPTGPGGKDDAGWYIVYPDGVPAGTFGDWRTGDVVTWRADVGRKLTAAEEMAITRRLTEAKRRREEEQERRHHIASSTVEDIWSNCVGADPEHPYLKRKGIQPNGARVTGDGRLIVPLFNEDGEIQSVQYIDHTGKKLYHSGGATGGMYWTLGEIKEKVYISEGYATGATIREIMDSPVVVAYSAGNLEPVVGKIRKIHPLVKIIIVADNDASQVGQRYAEQAAAKHGAVVVVPPEPGDANDYHQNGHDLHELLNPKIESLFVSADEWATEPTPIKWFVRGWIQQNALIMVHGPSGSGKTFQVLDWCLRMSSGLKEWRGKTVNQSPVVYLAGEGHYGLRGRIAAWKQHHGVSKCGPMWLSKGGMDLNLPGPLQTVIQQIRALDEVPGLIVVDTLHRFLSGDENSAQDAKTMLDACAVLMREFSCSVLLVHHTGVSEEAQHRARGSSAWRGALDIEVSIRPNGEHGLKLEQKKSKDSELEEPFNQELESVKIDGWIDDEGNPVASAVVVRGEDESVELGDGPKISTDMIMHFRAAWEQSGSEWEGMNGKKEHPYLSKSALRRYLESTNLWEKTYIDNMMKPSYRNGILCKMSKSGLIKDHVYGPGNAGYIVIDETLISAWSL